VGLTDVQRCRIENLLERMLERKLKSYSRETTSMPFLVRLMQDSRSVAAYSFVHSLSTSLGMTVYEDVSVILAEGSCSECFKRYDVGGVISRDQEAVINDILQELRSGRRTPHYDKDMSRVLAASAKGGRPKKDGAICDFYMVRDREEFLVEIKTVKPNIDVFTKSKQKLLEWIARRRKRIRAILAFPYNPYHPNPYRRFTEQNLMDAGNDFLVGEEYWDMLCGAGAYDQLLDVFDRVGKRWKERIQEKVAEVARAKLEGI